MNKIETPFGLECPFCEMKRYIVLTDNKINSKDRYCLELRDNKLEILKQTGNSIYWDNVLESINDISYCPFCGRKLVGDTNVKD